MSLGQKKIDWVGRFMPLLNSIESEYAVRKPLNNFKVGMSIHLEAKTAYLALLIKKTWCRSLHNRE